MSEQGRARYGMCELTHGMTGERHGNGKDAAGARHTIYESALTINRSAILTVCDTKSAIIWPIIIIIIIIVWTRIAQSV